MESAADRTAVTGLDIYAAFTVSIKPLVYSMV
jgi:hypothetical protein